MRVLLVPGCHTSKGIFPWSARRVIRPVRRAAGAEFAGSWVEVGWLSSYILGPQILSPGTLHGALPPTDGDFHAPSCSARDRAHCPAQRRHARRLPRRHRRHDCPQTRARPHGLRQPGPRLRGAARRRQVQDHGRKGAQHWRGHGLQRHVVGPPALPKLPPRSAG